VGLTKMFFRRDGADSMGQMAIFLHMPGFYDVVYMDFNKAFNKVLHGRLINKVRAHGIQGNLANWIQNWLGGRG